jgi:putative spermidine/putrescine transport system substrate-binding protein
MRITRSLLSGTAISLVTLLAAACGTSSGDSSPAPGASGFTPPKIDQLQQLGAGEGAVSILAWPGYAENGSNDPAVDWVTPFEKQTRLQGHGQDVRHFRRGRDPDEDRWLRRGVGLR